MTAVIDSHSTTLRTRVLIGEDDDPSRRGSKQMIAKSECRFICPDDSTLERCVQQIKASDEHLRSRPAERMLWDWQSTYVEKAANDQSEGGVVVLGVAWYDDAFFQEKRFAYTDAAHLAMYFDIGLPTGAITVSHWRLVDSGSV